LQDLFPSLLSPGCDQHCRRVEYAAQKRRSRCYEDARSATGHGWTRADDHGNQTSVDTFTSAIKSVRCWLFGARTANETPANATHWNRLRWRLRWASARRAWAHLGRGRLETHLVRLQIYPTTPWLEEKVIGVVGLYMNPGAGACAWTRRVRSTHSIPAEPTLEEGPRGDHDARPKAPRNDHAVRGARCEERPRHRRMPAGSPCQGVRSIGA